MELSRKLAGEKVEVLGVATPRGWGGPQEGVLQESWGWGKPAGRGGFRFPELQTLSCRRECEIPARDVEDCKCRKEVLQAQEAPQEPPQPPPGPCSQQPTAESSFAFSIEGECPICYN